MASTPPSSNTIFTVGWICALPLEMAAAKAMLDESYGDEPVESQHERDDNSYHLGRVGGHNVVIACLPMGRYGLVSAAKVATQMLFTFPAVRVGLMVGIGGGIPSKNRDVRLGDVVVSRPEGTTGGVVQYDLGKMEADGKFEVKGMLNKPPAVLLNAMARLESEHEFNGTEIPELLKKALQKARAVGFKTKFAYQGPENDILFEFDYEHVLDEETCDECDHERTVKRSDEINRTECPVIHYGIIASGNQVIKHGRTREAVVDKFKAICFEMEAAGLMDSFPCVVIRGICDYSDSHKNDRWQRYAALTAAAYTKELLSMIPPRAVENTQPAVSLIKTMQKGRLSL